MPQTQPTEILIIDPIPTREVKPEQSWFSPSLSDVLVACSLVIAVITYWLTNRANRQQRNSELKWKQVAFLCDQYKHFDSDDDISDAAKTLAGNNPGISTDDFLQDEYGQFSDKLTAEQRGEHRHKLDKLLNLLERVAYSVDQNTIKLDEASLFGWYFEKVSEEGRLGNYVEEHYSTVYDMGQRLVVEEALEADPI